MSLSSAVSRKHTSEILPTSTNAVGGGHLRPSILQRVVYVAENVGKRRTHLRYVMHFKVPPDLKFVSNLALKRRWRESNSYSLSIARPSASTPHTKLRPSATDPIHRFVCLTLIFCMAPLPARDLVFADRLRTSRLHISAFLGDQVTL